MLNYLQRQGYISFRHIVSILSTTCDCSGRWTMEWIFILKVILPILANSNRHPSSKWRYNTVSNIDMCQSINQKAYWVRIFSSLQQLQYLVNFRLMHVICPLMMTITQGLTMWQKRHPDKAIAQHTYWLPPGSIWLHCLNHQRTVSKLIHISIIGTVSRWRLAVHCGYRITLTVGNDLTTQTPCALISLVWHET